MFIVNPSRAQISMGGEPPSFKYTQLRSKTAEHIVNLNLDVKELQNTDDGQNGSPLPVALLLPVDYSIDNSGNWTTLPDGQRIWQLEIKAPGAFAIMLYYSNFYIPHGAKLFIYNAEKNHVLGAYTSKTNSSGGLFATEFIEGDAVILEYVASADSEEKPDIKINEIGYGYNRALSRLSSVSLRSDEPESCKINANCQEGDEWNDEKKGICHTVQKIGNKSYMCSGSLVNNTAEDFKPYILTARHCACVGGEVADSADMLQWMFYFHHILEGCSDTSAPAVSKSMTGCRLVFTSGTEGGSDGMLVLLNDSIPEDYDVYYNGWDCRHLGYDEKEIEPLSGVCLHHPMGDYMKISTFDETARTRTFSIIDFSCSANAHWSVKFFSTMNGFSIVQGGSSGSPLFNPKKQIVGTLSGTFSSCKDPANENLFGKMSYHWDKYKVEGDSVTGMDYWLDPLNLGTKIFHGRSDKETKPGPTDLSAYSYEYGVFLTWNPPSGDENVPEKYLVYRNNLEIISETTSLSFIDKIPVNGNHNYSVSAIYEGGEESFLAHVNIDYHFAYKPPTDLKADIMEFDNQDYVIINYTHPLYNQTIHWGSLNKVDSLGFAGRQPFYFGHKWMPEELNCIENKPLTSVLFIPLEGNAYEVYISQGEHKYTQKINTPNYGVLDTVDLEEPFIINSSEPLYVSIYASSPGASFPAACDGSPVVEGKGNVFSFNGEDWFSLNEYSRNEYDHNFVIAAVVTYQDEFTTYSGKSINSLSLPGVITSASPVEQKSASLFESVPTSSKPKTHMYNVTPVPFPELFHYNIYICDEFGIIRRSYMLKNYSASTPVDESETNVYYYLTAVYRIGIWEYVESYPSEIVYLSDIVSVENISDNVDISPTRFSDYLTIKGYDKVKRVEVISAAGQVCLRIDNPGNTISTSALSPGFYFFRITTNKEVKVIRGIKTGR